MDNSSKRIWTKDFLLNSFIFCFVNTAYIMLMIVITDYTIHNLNASLGEASIICGIFIIGSLTARFLSASCMNLIGFHYSLFIGLLINFIALFANLFSNSLLFLLIARFFQGLGFGIATTATGTIVSLLIPKERRGEGISYYGMFLSLSTAVGPFIGISLYQNHQLTYNLIIAVLLLAISCIFCIFLHVPQILSNDTINDKENLPKFIEPSALPISFIMFLIGLCFAGLMGFFTSFTTENNFDLGAKLFFTVYAIMTVSSRPFTGRLFDKKGPNFVLYPSFISLSFGLLILATATSDIGVIISSIFIGLGYGTYISCANALVIRDCPPTHVGLATATFFIFMDTANGAGPYLLSQLIPFIQFRGLYIFLSIIALSCSLLYYLLYVRPRKSNKIYTKSAINKEL